MIYLGLILKIVGLWTLCALTLAAAWCVSRWLVDRRARANVARFGPLQRRKGYDYQREWPITSTDAWARENAKLDWDVERASGGEAA